MLSLLFLIVSLFLFLVKLQNINPIVLSSCFKILTLYNLLLFLFYVFSILSISFQNTILLFTYSSFLILLSNFNIFIFIIVSFVAIIILINSLTYLSLLESIYFYLLLLFFLLSMLLFIISISLL